MVTLSTLIKDINGIHKILGERVIYYPERSKEIVDLVNNITKEYRDSTLRLVNEERLSSNYDLTELESIINQAKSLNSLYDEFLKAVGLARIN